MPSNPTPEFIAGLFVSVAFIFLVYVFVLVLPFWMIFSKAGYSGALSLLLLIPLIGVVVLYVIAFSDWPVLRELRQWRDWHRSQQDQGRFPAPESR